MRLIGEALRLSASDLMRFKGCRHATTMDLRRIEIGDIRPGQDGAEALLLQRQGDEHELAFLDSLKTDGRLIVEIPKEGLPLEESVRLTHEAMAAGPDVIFQGALLDGAWGGYTDFLERVDRPSALGGWSYEVVDTKLKRKPDPKHVLQLCLYSDLLAIVQGVAPEAAHLELGDGSRFTVKLSEVSAYARYARGMLEAFLVERPETQPEPVSACALCSWSETCADRWATEDSLALVAGLSRSQRQKLGAVGVVTMAGLAAREDRVPRMAAETQRRLVTQARLQSARRAGGPATFELREAEPGKGFGIMPAPDDGDIFYDIEGDPYYPGGLEYLHGLWYREAGEWVFRAFWAHTREDEGGAVSELLGFLVDHMRRHPFAHIYHYANYEIAALRRLTSQHRTGEAAMDQLQRERRFVDLFKVVSGSLIASEKGYSIKDLEAFYMEKRAADVSSAGASVVFYEEWRQTGEQRLLDEIHDYNRTDCISTQLLRDWLVREVRPGAMAWPALGEVPDSGYPPVAWRRGRDNADRSIARSRGLPRSAPSLYDNYESADFNEELARHGSPSSCKQRCWRHGILEQQPCPLACDFASPLQVAGPIVGEFLRAHALGHVREHQVDYQAINNEPVSSRLSPLGTAVHHRTERRPPSVWDVHALVADAIVEISDGVLA